MERLFVSIPVPAAIKQHLTLLGSGLPGARWQTPEQMHLTLRFIGDVDGTLASDIHSALSTVKAAPFTLELAGVGTFGPRGRERILWAGVAENSALRQLRDRIESTLVRTGVAPETRKFHPHVTIARLNGVPKGRLNDFVGVNSPYRSAPFPVKEFALYSSFLSQSGAIHRVEETYALQAMVPQNAVDRGQVAAPEQADVG